MVSSLDHQAVVHGQLARQVLCPSRRLDRVQIAHQVGDGNVRCGELFHVAIVALQERNRRSIAPFSNQIAASFTKRHVWIVANLASGHVRRLLIEQCGKRSQDATLGLSAQPQQNKILLRQNGIHNLRNHRVFVADDAGKKRFSRLEARNQVGAHLVLDGSCFQAGFRELCTGAQFPQYLGKRASCGHL